MADKEDDQIVEDSGDKVTEADLKKDKEKLQ